MQITLNVKNRQKGEKLTAGFIPAVMYGAHANSTSITINKNEFIKVLRSAGESSMITLTGDSKENVLIQDVQMDPVAYTPRHADLYVIEKGQKVNVEVPLNFIGEAPAVKLGANLVKVLHSLSLEADPTSLPQSIDVDLSVLVDLNSNIHIKDIAIPKGATLYHVSPDDVVVSVVSQSEEDLSEPIAQVDMDAVAVQEKGKKEEVAE